jgi:sodium transport system permease protein
VNPPAESVPLRQLLQQSPIVQGLAAFISVLVISSIFSPVPTTANAVLKSVLLQLVLVLAIPLGLAAWLKLDKGKAFHLRPTSVLNLLWCFVLTLCCLFLLDEIAFWQEKLTGISASLRPEVEQLLHVDSLGSLIGVSLSLGIVPAVCEEFLFRGFILSRFLATGNPGWSLMMTAILFGVFHRNLPALLTTSLAGLLLALVVWRTGSLYNAIVMHGVVNGWAIVVVNTGISEWLPWLDRAGHVPVVLQVGCLAGLWAGVKQLKPALV